MMAMPKQSQQMTGNGKKDNKHVNSQNNMVIRSPYHDDRNATGNTIYHDGRTRGRNGKSNTIEARTGRSTVEPEKHSTIVNKSGKQKDENSNNDIVDSVDTEAEKSFAYVYTSI